MLENVSKCWKMLAKSSAAGGNNLGDKGIILMFLRLLG